MKKYATFILFSIFSLFFFVPATLAITVDTIGSSQVTTGNPGTDWYYTSQNPLLTGTATAGSSVSIKIDETTYPITADSSGNWTYAPTTLTTGDRTVAVTGDGQTLSFTMHIGQSVPSTTSTSTSTVSAQQTLPVTGAIENTLLLLGSGTVLILGGWKLSSALNKN